MRYIVTDKGPIDRYEPGADVTGIYTGAALERLVQDGYISAITPKRKPKKKAVNDGS